MRLDEERESSNVEDVRGMNPRGLMVGGGIGTVLIALVVMLLGGDPSAILGGSSTSAPVRSTAPASAQDPERKHFVSVVLAETEDVWTELFRKSGKKYVAPKLVLFTGQVDSACGLANAAVGPFFCPEDDKVYIDLSFYDELRTKFGAPGDFAQAYVIAHEVGHHVQKLLGISDRVRNLQANADKREVNRLSVRLELQADFFAGVWAHYAKELHLDQQDIEEALTAASAIGDDRLQKQSRGYVVPDSFTHGTSAQRVRWFRKGWDTGDIDQGDTFSAQSL